MKRLMLIIFAMISTGAFSQAKVNSVLTPWNEYTVNVTARKQTPGTVYQRVDSLNYASFKKVIKDKTFEPISIFPTVLEAGDLLNISINDTSVTELIFDLYDTKGQLIFRSHSANMNSPYTFKYELPKLKPGVYLFSATNEYLRLSKKLVIK